MYQVLYVDDDEFLLEPCQIFLEEHGEFSVTTALSAKLGLELLKTRSFDAIVADYQMPVMDGIAFLKEVRARYDDIPFILFTGRGREEVAIESINHGADFYVQKGGDPDAQFAELMHKIRKAVGRRRTEDALRASEERLQLFIQQAPVALAMFDTEMRYLAASQRWIADYRLGDQDLIGRSHYEIFPEIGDTLKAVHRRGLGGETISCSEDRFERLDGSFNWIEWEVRPWFTPTREIGGIIIFSADITPRKTSEAALKESEARYRALFESANDAIFLHQLEENGWPGRFVMANTVGCRFLGYSREELLNMRQADFVPESFRNRMPELVDQLSRNGEVRFETEYPRKDGTVLQVEVSVTRFEAGGSPYALTFVRDITSRKQMVEELRHTAREWERTFNASRDAIWILDREQHILRSNKAAEKMFGASEADLKGRFCYEVVHQDNKRPIHNCPVLRAKETGHFESTELALGDRLFEVAVDPFLDADGNFDGAVHIVRDITQRKADEEKLQTTLQRFYVLLSSMPYGIMLITEEEKVEFVNQAFCDMFLLSESPENLPGIEGKKFIEMLRPAYADPAAAEARIFETIKVGQPVLGEEVAMSGGRTFLRYFVPVPLGGKHYGRMWNHIDISDRKLMESEIRSINRVLELRVQDRTEALSRANTALEAENAQRVAAEEKLKAAYDQKVILLKEIHHRVKNNLQIIASLLNIQARYVTDEPTLAAIRESQNRVRAMALVHEKLYRSDDISRISLRDYVQFLGTGLFQFYDAKGRGIRFLPDIHDISVDIDAAIPLGLIINELLSNSLKYAFPEGRGGEIAISVRQDGHMLSLQFRDNGIGMPEEMDWKNAPSLGLRLVNTLVGQMDGTIELDRSSGTRFTITLQEKAPQH